MWSSHAIWRCKISGWYRYPPSPLKTLGCEQMYSYTHRQHVDACLVETLILICDFHIVSHQCSFSLLETGTKFEYLFCSLIIDTLHTFSCFFFYSFHLFVFSLCIEIFTLRSLISASLPSCLFLSHTPAVFLSQGGMFGERQASLPVMDSYNG